MEWSIQQLAKLAGITSRTLRYYGSVGILQPSRIGNNGYRYYDELALARLQRILLLRDLGVSIAAIADSIDNASDADALGVHLTWLREERNRLARQIAAVQHTVAALEGAELMNAEATFDGFDNSQYEQEVTDRWGATAWKNGQQWWSAIGKEGQRTFQQEHQDLIAGYSAAMADGLTADSDTTQALAERHYRWIGASWQREPEFEAFLGLGEMYVADPRFAENYGGVDGAMYVRDAMRAFVEARQ